MAATYVPITESEMDELLIKQAKNPFTKVNPDGCCREIVYDLPYRNAPNIVLRVYSSIVEGQGRDVGKDAIRVILYNTESKMAIKKAVRTHRVANWRETLKAKIVELYVSLNTVKRCKRCAGFMVERKNLMKGNKFLGCSSYPRCRHTEPMEG